MHPYLMLRAFRLISGVLTLTALATQLWITWTLNLSLLNFFSYYTILSNLFAGVVLVLSALPAMPDRRVASLRFISVVNMTLVGLVFVTLLRKTDLGPLLPWVNAVHHYVMPCVVLADWLIFPPRVRLGARTLLVALCFPLGYLCYALIRGYAIGWYPYPFLDARLVGGTRGVMAYVVAITVIFCLVGSALLFISNRRRLPAAPG